MSFGLPSLRDNSVNPRYADCGADSCGITNATTNKLPRSYRDKLESAHPLERSEKTYAEREELLNMSVLRGIQGIHAPLRLAMEMNACKGVGRLPFLPSSNLSLNVIRGRDDYLEFEDLLYPEDVHEHHAQPHVVCESKSGIL